MIVADKRYVDQKASIIPSPENFRTAVNDSLNFTYASYASWVNCEALQEECFDVAKLFKKRYPGNNCYYDVSKIGDGMYVVEETSGEDKRYYPYVSDKTVVNAVVWCYLDYDSAVLAVVAMKYMNTESSTKVADMVMILEKLIDKSMVNIQ